MAKVKSPDKTHYEMLFIIPNKFTEDEAEEINKKVKKIITDNDGKITHSEDWGKKKLAYPINNFNHGYYRLLEFDLWGKDLEKIDNTLRMFSEVLRHQVVKKPKRSEEEIKKEKERSEELARKKKGGEKEEKIEEKKGFKLIGDAKDKGKEEKRAGKKKTTLKDLDKKLDDILKTDDLL